MSHRGMMCPYGRLRLCAACMRQRWPVLSKQAPACIYYSRCLLTLQTAGSCLPLRLHFAAVVA